MRLDDEMWQNGQVVVPTNGQKKVGMCTMRREKYIRRSGNAKCEKNECYVSGVDIDMEGTRRRLRPAHLQSAVAEFLQSPAPALANNGFGEAA